MMIHRLPQNVINAIAAGEVIHRPYNVVKELAENAIDAGATSLNISIAEGGLQAIQITDNGSGINLADFPLLCERFATSKIQDMRDLETISSFGFRGEALASLSYVSDLQISSRVRGSPLGHKCSFRNQKMQGSAVEIPMKQGTKISARELFMGLEARRSSLNAGEEKKRILCLVFHLALHYSHIKFTFETPKGIQFVSQGKSPNKPYKISEAKMRVFQELTKLPYDKFIYIEPSQLGDITISAILTKINSCKGKKILLNVNNRIVDNPQVMKLVENAYAECYQSIHQETQSFFVYLNLQLEQRKIDCNQHPSKKTVGFFGAHRIYEHIFTWIRNNLKGESSIKHLDTAMTKTKISFNIENINKVEKTQIPKPKETYAYDLNRTDSKQLPINFYVSSQSTQQKVRFLFTEQAEQTEYPHVREFFRGLTYVGCYNLNYMLIHVENSLYLLNTLPFIPSFIRQHLKTNPLLIKPTNIPIEPLLHSFVKENNASGKVSMPDIMEQIKINPKKVARFGVAITEDKVVGCPILNELLGEVSEDQLSYFLIRIYRGGKSQVEEEEYFMELLSSVFREQFHELSPLNDKYSQFLRDRLIPLLKTKCRHTSSISIQQFITPMLHLKDVYQIFERC